VSWWQVLIIANTLMTLGLWLVVFSVIYSVLQGQKPTPQKRTTHNCNDHA